MKDKFYIVTQGEDLGIIECVCLSKQTVMASLREHGGFEQYNDSVVISLFGVDIMDDFIVERKINPIPIRIAGCKYKLIKSAYPTLDKEIAETKKTYEGLNKIENEIMKKERLERHHRE